MTELARAIDQALAAIDPAETIALAQQLIRIPSVTGREGAAISETVAAWLTAHGIATDLQEIAPGRVNVIGRLEGAAPGPRLLLNGHLDTKPFDGMTIDPTGAAIRDGRLWGRGACDMKSGVAAILVAARAVRDTGALRRGTLLVGFEVGEEGGGWTFPQLLAGPGACDAMICAEPTNLEVHIGARGGMPLTITTYGVATHSGMAHHGINAIQKMARVIEALYALPEFAEEEPAWGRSPVNCEQIAGGGMVSASVPDRCDLRVDIRLNPGLPPERLRPALEAMLDRLRAADPDLIVEWAPRVAPWRAAQIALDDPLLQAVEGAAARVLGQAARAGFPGGCSALVALNAGIPSVIFGPGHIQQAHTVDEWIAVDQIPRAAQVYACAALSYLSES
ncbi:MAG: M20/M25/M40 family metallo-hydrolase [Chloroflexota bacterium]|nr:M20/M25/M40 family metallo-hydrolase [Dehalococcoidia bacterium]MDW8254571.1 M20/M25/M40 family metallo-hydrolase [Chloroflexota bacterium]